MCALMTHTRSNRKAFPNCPLKLCDAHRIGYTSIYRCLTPPRIQLTFDIKLSASAR